jgi:endoglucanase
MHGRTVEIERTSTSVFHPIITMLAGMTKSAILCSVIVFTCVLPAASPCRALDKAAATAQQMAGGVNILGYDGIWDGGVDAPFNQRYFKSIRDAGFHHVRINLSAFKYMDSRNDLDPRILARLDWVLEQAVANDLIPIIDEHDSAIRTTAALSCALSGSNLQIITRVDFPRRCLSFSMSRAAK